MRIREARLIEPRRMEIAERDLLAAPGQTIVEIAACGYCITDVHKYLGEDLVLTHRLMLEEAAKGMEMAVNGTDGYIKGLLVPNA